MINHIVLGKGWKVRVMGDSVVLQKGEDVIRLSLDIEVLEELENNLGLISIAKRAENTIKATLKEMNNE